MEDGKKYSYRRNHPVEGSTVGKSKLINPREYKGDMSVQVWMDSRVLATLSNWLDMGGVDTWHLSEVVKICLEVVMDAAIRSNEVEFIEFTEDARELLKAKYRIKLNPHERGKMPRGYKNIQNNIMLDEVRRGGLPKRYGGSCETDDELKRVARETLKNMKINIDSERACIDAGVEELERKQREKDQEQERMFDALGQAPKRE